MTGSSPSDLVITFRSVARRTREAQGDVPDAAVAAPLERIRSLVAAAARTIRSAPDAAAVADAIAARPPDDWSGTELDDLRTVALDLGTALRQLAAAAERAAG